MIVSHEGVMEGIRYLPSPHFNARPEGVQPDLLVIHGITLPPGASGTGYIEDFFCGKLDFTAHPAFTAIEGLRVSAHLLIARTGEIIQFVPFHMRAWHAGQSIFQGRDNCNDYSVGIELEGTDDIPYTDAQYEQLARVIRYLAKLYPGMTRDRIVGHCDVAPGRKTDPGPWFDWDRL